MSITLISSPRAYSFAGNAITFGFRTSTAAEFNLTLVVEGSQVPLSVFAYRYSDSFFAEIDVAPFLRSYFKPYSLSEDSDVIQAVDDFDLNYSIKLADVELFSGRAFRGGIDSGFYNYLDRIGLDIFSFRLRNPEAMFLFTSRTQGNTLKLRRSELCPFMFIHPGVAISFISGSGNTITPGLINDGVCCSMNIAALLQLFSEQYTEDVSHIKVMCDGLEAFTIDILPESASWEKYTILFKNSLGAYEYIEVTGKATHNPEIGEENIWQQSTGTGSFEDYRDRLTLRDSLDVYTGFRTKGDLIFIMDAIASDESYFIYPDGSSFRCLITAEGQKYDNRITTPTSFQLKVRSAVDERYLTPPISMETDKLRWILENGQWNDNGQWVDNAVWND